MDNLTPERRHAAMAAVRSQDTSPEVKVRRIAHRLGLRFRLHRRDLPGSPDLLLPRHGLAVFVHGCFWHRHPRCRRATMPRSNIEYWQAKFDRTVERDARAASALTELGWRVLVLWECELGDEESVARSLLNAVGPPPDSLADALTKSFDND